MTCCAEANFEKKHLQSPERHPLLVPSSMKRSWVSLLCLNTSLLCQVLSVGFGKQAALSMTAFSLHSVVTNRYYLLSIICLVIQAVLWPIALRHYQLSFAYLYMSGAYPVILFMSWLVFFEKVTMFNIVGSLFVVAGINIMLASKESGHG